jgi:hypothetical protein
MVGLSFLTMLNMDRYAACTWINEDASVSQIERSIFMMHGNMSGGTSGNDSMSNMGGTSFSSDSDESIRQLNSFLRGEISAAETYRMAIDKVADSEEHAANVGLLREIQEEHGRAAQAIRDRIRELGGEASDSSGPWGTWAKFTQGTANLFGDTASLKSLKEGEEHGMKDYEAGLDEIDMTSGELVQNQLMPAQRRHINLLDQLISAAGSA